MNMNTPIRLIGHMTGGEYERCNISQTAGGHASAITGSVSFVDAGIPVEETVFNRKERCR